MKSLTQLFRQPLRTIAGILLVTLAVSVMAISLSQTLAAENTAQKLKESFLCVALPTDRALAGADWIDGLIAENPDIVTRDVKHGIASAYIPALRQDNEITHLSELQHLNQNHYHAPTAPVYSGGILEVEILSVESAAEGTILRYDISPEGIGTVSVPDFESDYRVMAKVISAHGIEENYPDYVGYTALLYFDAESFAATAGDRYLIRADVIKDLDWRLRSFLVHNRRVMFWDESIEVPYWHLDTLEQKEDWTTVTTWDENGNQSWKYELVGYEYKCRIADLYFTAKRNDAWMFRTLEIDLGAVDGNSFPFMRLEGSVEELLAGDNPWSKSLADQQINNHAYAVVGVEQLNLVADFALKTATISQGRDFTAEELGSGAKVCILSEDLAALNGLAVGDTVDPQFYAMTGLAGNLVTPTAQGFDGDTMTLAPAEAYTIVGLYDQQIPWGNVDNNFFQFTPNTIFVPKASVPVTLAESDAGLLRTLVLKPERMRDLQLMTVDAGYDAIFTYTDNGYSGMAHSLEGYREAAWKILPLGLIVYAVLMALYLFLFPGRQGRELVMMDSMGANIFRKLSHGLLSCGGILVPGSVAGTAVGLALWEQVALALATYMDTQVDITLDTNLLWLACGIQIAAVLAVTGVIVAVLAGTHNYMRRK